MIKAYSNKGELDLLVTGADDQVIAELVVLCNNTLKALSKKHNIPYKSLKNVFSVLMKEF